MTGTFGRTGPRGAPGVAGAQGAQGPAGSQGAAGPAGPPGYGTTSADAVQPAVAATVTLTLQSAPGWAVVGGSAYIPSAGAATYAGRYTITAIAGSTLTLRLEAAGDVAPAGTLASGSVVLPALSRAAVSQVFRSTSLGNAIPAYLDDYDRVLIECLGSSASGAAGGTRGAGVAVSGGAGGATGAYTTKIYFVYELRALGSTYNVTASAGGAAVSGHSTSDTDGAVGIAGGPAQVTVGGRTVARAEGAGAATGGRTTAPGAASGGAGGTTWGVNGSGSAVGATGTAGTRSAGLCGGSGGQGGGIDAANVGYAGGSGGFRSGVGGSPSGGAAGGAVATAGTAGFSPAVQIAADDVQGGGGGGGGGAGVVANAGNGGAGGEPGGGGGGGGAARNGFRSGDGGKGGDGLVRITWRV